MILSIKASIVVFFLGLIHWVLANVWNADVAWELLCFSFMWTGLMLAIMFFVLLLIPDETKE